MEAADQIHHDEGEERDMRRPAGTANRTQEAGIDTFQHQRPVDQGESGERQRGDAGDQQQGLVVERQHAAEQEVQEVDIGAFERHDGDSDRERNQEECGE